MCAPPPQSTVADADKPPEIFCNRFQAHLPICPLHNPQHAPKYDVVPSPFLTHHYSLTNNSQAILPRILLPLNLRKPVQIRD
jgi:hypothetical protein